jgi:acetyltransferase-like isoleucine patch superfamily enzyme
MDVAGFAANNFPESRTIRQIKILIITASNFIYQWIPFFRMKNLFLKFLGIKLGQGSVIHTPARFMGIGRIRIGSHTVINRGCYLDNRIGITIGSNVSIAHDTKIYTLGHDIDDPLFRVIGRPVEIDDYVCIFSNVLIMPGVRLGLGAVVFPGSVVTKSVGDFEVVGGNPARFIRHRSRDLRYKVTYDYWLAF